MHADKPQIDQFTQKVRRRILQILVFLSLIATYGTLGFFIIEDAPLFDAFYMTVITMTTVGYAEIFPLSSQGRLFAVTTIFVGLIGSGISIAVISNLIFEETLRMVFKGRKMDKILKKLKDHYIVCGFGTTGKSIVAELTAQNEKVLVINQEPIGTEEYLFIQGDARDDDVLIRARIMEARGLATTLTEDSDNVFVTLTARSLNPELNIVSRFKDDDTEKKLAKAGADQAISPYRMGGQRLALALTNPAFQEILEATYHHTKLEVRYANIHVPRGSFLSGKLLRDSQIRKYSKGALIVAVIEKNGNTIFNPGPDLAMENVEQLLVMGNNQQIGALEAYFEDSSGPG